MDRIIVKRNADMQRVLDWSQELRGMTLELPFSEGEIEFQEEELMVRFRDEGAPWIWFELYVGKNPDESIDGMDYKKCCEWRCDMEDGGIADLKILGEHRAELGLLLAQDDTVGKCVRKFRALMLFAAYYREDIQRTRSVHRKVVGGKKAGKPGKAGRRMLTIRKYTVSDEMLDELPAPKKEWHGYAESFGVRGHFRHLRSGAVVWVRPYEKKGRLDKKSDKEYVL